MSSSPNKSTSSLAPATPEQLGSLSRELESVIAAKNMLTCRTRSRVLRELNEAASEGEERVMQRLRANAVRELVESERSYLRHLEIVEEFFMRPVKEGRVSMPQAEFVTVFGDLPSIIQVNKELLASLEGSTDRVGQVFLELAPYLKFYSTYAQDFEGSARVVERAMTRSKSFGAFVRGQETRPEVQLRLNALLITPVQRIPRYKMLLEDVIKNTPDCHPDKKNLKEALEQIDALAWYINDQLKEHEMGQRMIDIQKSLVGGHPKILAAGRRLVKHGNLMKVPRAGGSAQPRYFVLFSDIIIYCKIRIATGNQGSLVLPKANSLECGLVMPLKTTTVESLVGKGVFKLTCEKEQLILYSVDEAARSEEWVDIIGKTIDKHRKDAATLQKADSVKREPLRRVDMLKMRRDSLSQIMFNASKKKVMALRPKKSDNSSAHTPAAAPRKPPLMGTAARKRRQQDPLPPTPDQIASSSSSPSKIAKKENETPRRSAKKQPAPPPPPPKSTTKAKTSPKQQPKVDDDDTASESSVKLRSRKIIRPAWKSLSLSSRKDKLKEEADRSKQASAAVFRSPSIYDAERKGSSSSTSTAGGSQTPNPVMASYLSGKICPLTPSQQQTDVSHLVQKELKQRLNGKAQATSKSSKKLGEEEGQGHGVEDPSSGGVGIVALSKPTAGYCALM